MGIGFQALNLTLSLWRDGWFDGLDNVIELGSQDLHAPQDELAIVFKELLKIVPVPGSGCYIPESFYKGMGFINYNCIDTDGRHNALVFDLNKNLSQEYGFEKTFGLVTNHGTSEHCFDQYQVFRNIHNLCAPGGIMLHALPFQGYLNHGFVNYQPCFFRYLAEANNYRMIGMYLNIDTNTGDLSTYSDALMNYIHLGPNPTMCLFTVMKKIDNEEFRVPFDGKYLGSSALAKREYPFQKVPTRFFLAEPFDIVRYIPTRRLAKMLASRVYGKIAFWRQ